MRNLCIFLFAFLFILSFISVKNSFASEKDLLKSINNQESSLFIEIGTDKTENVVFEGEEIYFYLAADKGCNFLLLRFTTGGELQLIFPNKSHPGYKVSGGEKYKIPGFGMDKFIAEGPGGFETVKAVAVTREDFFENLVPFSDEGDITIISNQETFLKILKQSLELLPADEWVTAELEISVEGDTPNISLEPTPHVDPELENLFQNNYKTEFYMQGTSYYEEGKYDDAVKMFKKAIDESPDFAYAYYSLGLSYQAKGAFSEAIEYYKKCLEQGVNERDCYVRVGEIYDQTGDEKEAYFRYKKALRETKGFEDINEIIPSDTGKDRVYELEINCKDKPHDKRDRMELLNIYEDLGNFKAGNYHLKVLLSQAIVLYEPYALEEDKPEIEKPQVPVEPAPQSYYYDPYPSYTYYEPYPEPYIPPPPPPAEESPSFIFVED